MVFGPRLSLLLLLLLALSGIASSLQLKKRGHLRKAHHRAVRNSEQQRRGDPIEGESFDDVDYEPFQNPDIIKKYDGLEAVAEVLFTIACRANHKSDVKGAAKAMSRDRGWKMPRMMEYIKEIQGAQVADLKRSCGLLTGSSSNRCLKGCTERWASGGSMSRPEQKQNCINMCNIKHKNWEAECYEQVGKLKHVYEVEQGQLTGASHCVERHCPKFPHVSMINNDDKEAKLSEQQGIVDAGCDKMCSEAGIKATCEREFTLNVDFVMVDIEEACHGEEQGAMESCMDSAQGDIDADFDKCKEEDGGKCADAGKACMDGQEEGTMSAEEGQKFCDERQKMCEEQVSKHCAAANEKAQKEATKGCKADYDAGMEKCISKATKKRRKEDVKACVEKTGPACQDDCQHSCQLEDLDACQSRLADAGRGVTSGFCEDFWQWIYDSEQVDPATGDPIPRALAVNDRRDAPDLLADE